MPTFLQQEMASYFQTFPNARVYPPVDPVPQPAAAWQYPTVTPATSPLVHTGHLILSQSRPLIPEIYKMFEDEKFQSDNVAWDIQDFMNAPSLSKLFEVVKIEVLGWKCFVETFDSQHRKLLHLQVKQISAAHIKRCT